MEVSIESDALWVIWRNPNLRATYFMAGALMNMGQAMPRLSYRVTWKGRNWEVIDRSVPGVIAGRLDPWIVTLPHGAEFRYRVWLRELAVIEHSTGQWWTLGSIAKDGWAVEVTLSAPDGLAGQTPYPLWSGKLTARAELKPNAGKPAGK